MKRKGVIIYSASLFLLYLSLGVKVVLSLASVSLSVMYVWTMILWLIRRKDRSIRGVANGFLVANLAAILASFFIIKPLAAALLLMILLALSGFVVLVVYGIRKGPAIENADLRLRWFGVLLLGFFSLNPFIEGISSRNWIEVVAVAMLVFGGYLMFEDLRRPAVGIGHDREHNR